MKIGIIGAGNVGRALATAGVRAGHAITVTSTNAEEAGHVAAEVGAAAARSNAEVVDDANLVILAVPFDAVQGIVSELGSRLEGKVLIDVTNRFSPEQLDGTSNAELIQRMAPNAKVVKAFNTTFAGSLVEGEVSGQPLDVFVASDDDDAKAKVRELAESAGLRVLDAGPLALARQLEGAGYLHMAIQPGLGGTYASALRIVS
jgi:predicted dinucleotide-binding enzyme